MTVLNLGFSGKERKAGLGQTTIDILLVSVDDSTGFDFRLLRLLLSTWVEEESEVPVATYVNT